MKYTLELEAIIAFIEERVKEKIDLNELESRLNYSYRHIRGFFKKETGIPLSKYILRRKIAYCGCEILSSDKKITKLAYEYGFETYDTFTRAFKRETGVNPSKFKEASFTCGIKHICMGVYAPSIISQDGNVIGTLNIIFNSNTNHVDHNSCVLYGIPRVFYGRAVENQLQFTPFPMCLQVVLSYIGQEVHYSHLMAATGQSFRLTWNPDTWDIRAVDDRNIYHHPMKTFEAALRYVGRDYLLLNKDDKDYEKADFMELIKSEIDRGYPLIALGVFGPPDATIITGYKKDGEILLGQSLVQEHLEFSNDIRIDRSGYFECRDWWKSTIAVMSIGDVIEPTLTMKQLFENGLSILLDDEKHVTDRGQYFNGQKAYESLIKMLSNDNEFPSTLQYPSLINKMIAFRDAVSMIWDGRSYASGFIRWFGQENKSVEDESNTCSMLMSKVVAKCVFINELLGGLSGEECALKLADKSIRSKVITELEQAKYYELEASKYLKIMIDKL